MQKNMLKVNIKQFNEGEEDFSKYITDDGGLDVESLVNDYNDSENADESPEKIEESNPDNSEKGEGGPDISHEEEPPADTSQEGDEEAETHVKQDGADEKRTPDAAFAELRRRAEKNEKFANWVNELAKRQGFSDPEQLIEAFERQQLAREAQEKGVPVDVYERLQRLEKENKQKEQEAYAARFNSEVEQTKSKYKLDDSQLDSVFQYMAKNGYVDENGVSSISFEDAYILANKENLIKQAEERGRQTYLEEKQKLQKQATPNAGTSHADKLKDANELDYSKEGIFNKLAEFGIEVD